MDIASEPTNVIYLIFLSFLKGSVTKVNIKSPYNHSDIRYFLY